VQKRDGDHVALQRQKPAFLEVFHCFGLCTRRELTQCRYGNCFFAIRITFWRGHNGQMDWTTLSLEADTRRTFCMSEVHDKRERAWMRHGDCPHMAAWNAVVKSPM
jgi:hypothetical protein